jgi:hypothetical protein
MLATQKKIKSCKLEGGFLQTTAGFAAILQKTSKGYGLKLKSLF